jgi:magnesium-transporting ATPase (P-type)
MTVEEMWVDGKRIETQRAKGMGRKRKWIHTHAHTPYALFLTALALSNDAHLDTSGNIIGDPTEAALCIRWENSFQKKNWRLPIPCCGASFDSKESS